MKILGIDPGTAVMGWGVVESDGENATAVDYGAIRVPDRLNIGEKLNKLYTELLKVIKTHSPDNAAVEQPFVAKNVHSAFMVGRAQAIAILAAASKNIPTYEYTPAIIKQRVTNYGASSKEQVQEMVRLQLGLTEAPEPYDAADALAVALCHIQEIRQNQIFSGQEVKR